MHNIWHKIRSFIIFMGCVCLLLLTVFHLFQLPLDVLYVTLGCLLIMMVIYLIIQYHQLQVTHQETLAYQELQETFQCMQELYAQQQNELKAYFLMWVHQIKTPITASQLLLDQPNLDRVALAKEMTHIENYSNMALNYLKLTNPERDLVFTSVTIDELVKPLLRKYRWQFIANQIQLDYQQSECYILTDTNLTSLMIEQILNNALKYSDSGSKIMIYFDLDHSQLKIVDQGKGIPASDLPKIFDRGFSGFNGQLNQKSSGIGLYLVHLISQRLNQPVTVISKEKSGSCFSIQLQQA